MEEKTLSGRTRKKVKAQMEKAKRERMAKLLTKRMEYARNGATAFKAGNLEEALRNYFGYIEILEKIKEVGRDELQPKNFDLKNDMAELLLLTGVYWDLSKIHDLGGKKSYDRFRFYLDRFTMFSRGMPFQHVSAELIRKFLVNGSPRNRKELKNAHLQLGGGKCFLATAVEDHLPARTLPRLRQFRDLRLMESAAGRCFVGAYYFVGPWIARVLIRTPETFQKRFAGLVEKLADSLKVGF
ncbi:MAG: hypothetical protein KGP28_04870 [Bdellovibrionales bacterium]|nr:hypothetical protein [Bdellovibrionales bacterium]